MTLDQAVALYQQQKLTEAHAMARAVIEREPGNVRGWSLIGYLERDLGDAAAAAAAFDRALTLSPRDLMALKGRARMAMERDEADVLARYDATLAAAPGDPHVTLEQAEARLSVGAADPLDNLATLAARHPEWAEGQVSLARMRWEQGEKDHFADPVHRLLERTPDDIELWYRLVTLYQSCWMHAEAADTARAAGAHVQHPQLALLEAINAGHVGDLDRAEAVFAKLPPGLPGRTLAEAVHFVRRGDVSPAVSAIDAVLAADSSDISSWAVAELIWRWAGDPRSDWLSGQPGLVREAQLALAPDRFDAIHAQLIELHKNSSVHMAGQSVHAGKQTRGRLFDRIEPEFAELKRAVEAGIADYVAALPPADPRHPLLRHRDRALSIGGSWSVRFDGQGYHVSHTHPLGLLSSACYFEVPDAEGGEGELLLGAPPPDLKMDLAPLHVVTPQPGKMALFPSYLHHGTRPFTKGTRMSVAFDVIRDPGAA